MAFIHTADDRVRRTSQRRAALVAIGLFIASWSFLGWFAGDAADAERRPQTLAFVFGPGPGPAGPDMTY